MIILKEGDILKHTQRFGRWVKRFCTIDGHKLFLKKSEEDKLREEILLMDATVVESSAQNVNHSFLVITPHHTITLAAYSRKELEEWMSAIKQTALKCKNSSYIECSQHLDGQHSWFTCSHPRPTYCNVCGDALNGVAWHGLSCEVCKFKSHRRCVLNVSQECKWTIRSNIENSDDLSLPNLSIPHQWMGGNLPTGSKCIVCNRACGSVKRLQDFRCLWCKQTVHNDCHGQVAQQVCSLGAHSSCVLLPSAVKLSNEILHGMWEPFKLSSSSNPVLAFVNSKSGDNKGVRFLRRLKYWLNPLQVFDLAISGPEPGLQLFQRLDQFRVLVFGGDGSIGWVLSTIDKLHLHSKCIIGVVPLGTGNDLARVLGWGAQCGDEDKIPSLMAEMENSRVQLLDRWSIGFTKETSFSVNSLLRKNHSRSHSMSSFDGRSYGGSSSPLITQRSEPGSHSPSDSSLSLSPEPYHNHLSPLPHPHDSVSVNSSVSSCGYQTALSRSPSNGSVSEERDGNKESSHDKPCSLSLSRDVPSREEGKMGTPMNQHIKMLESHIVVVTPPQESSTDSLKWVGSIQESITSHLSTILSSGNDEQVVLSAQVLCEVVKQFINSIHSQQSMKLLSNQREEDPLMIKCTVLNEKLESLIGTLKSEIESSSNSSANNEQKELKVFQPRQTIMARANSLKKAIENIIDTTEQALDAQDNSATNQQVTKSDSRSSPDNQGNVLLPESSLLQSNRRSPLLLPDGVSDSPSLPSDFRELSCMNNYLGLGLDAKITYEFNTRRDENPSQYKNRAKNMLLYGFLGGREFFTNTQRHLERKLTLECDGKPIQLPQRLQGLVFLNIPSYMAGTNFWGTEREKEGFNAPSMDDKLVEVVGVTGFTHLATTKVLGIQNQRLAQCRYAKVVVHSEMPMQVDGEAKMQEPGIITVTHKNKARVIIRDKMFSQSFETWSGKVSPQGNKLSGTLPVTTLLMDALTTEEISCYQDVYRAVTPLIECIQLESEVNVDVLRDLMPNVATAKMCLDRVFRSTTSVSETADLEHLQDMESCVKSLIQETLWFLNMEKIYPERENEMRSLVASLELKVKKVILAQHSTKTIAHRGQRSTSDSVLVFQRSTSSSPKRIHRDRSTQGVEMKSIGNSRMAASFIGKEIVLWDTEDVCYWLKAVQLGEYATMFKENDITGADLMCMKTANLQDLGVTKPGHQVRFTQCLRVLK